MWIAGAASWGVWVCNTARTTPKFYKIRHKLFIRRQKSLKIEPCTPQSLNPKTPAKAWWVGLKLAKKAELISGRPLTASSPALRTVCRDITVAMIWYFGRECCDQPRCGTSHYTSCNNELKLLMPGMTYIFVQAAAWLKPFDRHFLSYPLSISRLL